MGKEADTQHQPPSPSTWASPSRPHQPIKESPEHQQQQPEQPQQSLEHPDIDQEPVKEEDCQQEQIHNSKDEDSLVPISLLQSQHGPHPPLSSSKPESGQMVCGSCRQLLSYPLGSKHVKCPCCKIVNYVLEEHQVGQVKCGNCHVLLMYPYGPLSVRCSLCSSVIYIGDHNRRPPLSVQQSKACRPFRTPH